MIYLKYVCKNTYGINLFSYKLVELRLKVEQRLLRTYIFIMMNLPSPKTGCKQI